MELSFLQKDACIAIGLMSGTSADGIDAAVVELRGCGTDTRVRQLGFITLPFSDEARQKILQVAGGAPLDSREICLLNFYLGGLSADACLEACRAAGIQPGDVDFVGSHGQTIWHEPAGADYLGRKVRATLQIGEPSLIAERLGCPVVSDFRVRDMAAGGLGAPLVPYTEYLLYREEHRTVALQNIGGIGNITVLPAGGALADTLAFDTGPGNMVIDALAARVTNGALRYDDGGKLARQGQVSAELLRYLVDSDDYLRLAPPKTTGREHLPGGGAPLPAEAGAVDRGRRRKPQPCIDGTAAGGPARLRSGDQRGPGPGQRRQGGRCLCDFGQRDAARPLQQRPQRHRRGPPCCDGQAEPVKA